MSRKRMIDPHIWESQDVNKLSHFERLILIGLFSNADDYGKGNAIPAYVRSIIFPYEDIPISKIEKALQSIERHISIVFYNDGENRFYCFTSWKKWQNVSHPAASHIPDNAQKLLANTSGNVPERFQHSIVKNNIKDSVIEYKLIPEKIPENSYFDNIELQDAFLSFIEFREKIKSPMTDKAIQLAVNELNSKCDSDELRIETINKSIMNGWKGLFPREEHNVKTNSMLSNLKEIFNEEMGNE